MNMADLLTAFLSHVLAFPLDGVISNHDSTRGLKIYACFVIRWLVSPKASAYCYELGLRIQKIS
jgi:hypothetical protein